MAKTKDNPVETMRLDIEFADNGIILRNPDCEDDVMLTLTGTTTYDNEYRDIGKKIYDWLVEVAIPDHFDYWVSTGARLSIKAELTGRKRK